MKKNKTSEQLKNHSGTQGFFFIHFDKNLEKLNMIRSCAVKTRKTRTAHLIFNLRISFFDTLTLRLT